MITDEIIFETAVVYEEPAELWQGQIVFNKHSLLEYTRRIIALAQEVRPLVFGRNEDGDLVCRTGCKIYVILNLSEGFGYAGRLYEIEEKAIAAAQDDFTRITLSNLVHGGKNET